jgi:hypothetical protein
MAEHQHQPLTTANNQWGDYYYYYQPDGYTRPLAASMAASPAVTLNTNTSAIAQSSSMSSFAAELAAGTPIVSNAILPWGPDDITGGRQHRPAVAELPSELPSDAQRSDSLSEVPSTRGSLPAGVPRIDYKQYAPPLFELSADSTTLTTQSAQLTDDAEALAACLRAQASVPPKPYVQVTGKRHNKVDFDIRLNLMPLLVPDDDRQRTNYVRCVASGETAHRGGQKEDVLPDVGDGGLEGWCRLFADDKTDHGKTFVFKRAVTNLDALWIDGQLRALLSAVGYKGNVAISFPVTHAQVIVQKPPRNRFVTGIKTMFKARAKYEVAMAIWPFADAPLGAEGRLCAVQSEEAWWREWRDAIRHAVKMKRVNCWITHEDKMEALMEGRSSGSLGVDWEQD